MKKAKLSIINLILITFTTIMLIAGLIIGVLVFSNWFDFADDTLTEISTRFDRDVYSIVEFYMENHWTGSMEDWEGLSNHLDLMVKDRNSMAVLVDKNTGELIANSINMDNQLTFGNGTSRPILIGDMGYPALTKAYNSYKDSNLKTHKLTNINSTFYIKISEYKDKGFEWLIITAIPDSQVTTTINETILFTILSVVAAMGLAIIVYYALIRKLTKPLYNLVAITERFAGGDFSLRVPVFRYDEIGLLTRAFNSMADTIYGLVNHLEDKVKERTLELEKANEDLEDNRNHLRLILDSTAEGIYGLDLEGNCTFCNNSVLDLLGYEDEDELIGKQMHYTIHHSRRDGSRMELEECKILKAIKDGTQVHVDDEVFWKKDGTYIDVEYSVYPQIKDDVVVGGVVSFMDITETKEAQEKIHYLSTHDPVTGLYNRQFIESEIKRIDMDINLPISIIYGDVNGLKLLNDIYGHDKGDELLRKTSEVLKKATRLDDIVARIGGDEFVIILKRTDREGARSLIKRIKSLISSERISGIKGSIALGTDTKSSPDQDIKAVINKAEEEMYSVKTLESKVAYTGMLDDIMEALFERSPREKRHSENVSRISGQIAKAMGLSEEVIKRIEDIGYYHDIGKIILDKDILNKMGRLDSKEQEEMERHTLIGYRILNLFNQTLDMAEVVLCHHESWDGSGYPKGLRAREIPLYSRIIAVAEGYDAMTNRVDDSGLEPHKALDEIKSLSGTRYDPEVVEAFLTLRDKKEA